MAASVSTFSVTKPTVVRSFTRRRSGACAPDVKALPPSGSTTSAARVCTTRSRGSRTTTSLAARVRSCATGRARSPERTQARTLVELGAGSANNIRLLLDELDTAGTLERFVPLDVSEQTLRASAQSIAAAYPRVFVHAIVGDFERDLGVLAGYDRRLIAFLGSTIGNLYPEQRGRFLRTLGAALTQDDALLLGVDLVKDVARLEAAYNDSGGVTEAFVRNALAAVNRELDGTFEQQRFVYEARWDPEHEWMDIGLRARQAHTVSLHGLGSPRGVRSRRAAPGRDQL